MHASLAVERSGGWQATQIRDSALLKASVGKRSVSMAGLVQMVRLPHEIQFVRHVCPRDEPSVIHDGRSIERSASEQ